jgi:hypothetical protein
LDLVKLSRGRHLKTIVKEAVTQGACVAEAIKLGEAEAEAKLNKKKTFFDVVRQHIETAIDRVDPIKLGMLAATTLLVYQTIKGTEGLVDELRKKVPLVEVGKDSFGLFLRGVFGTTFFATADDIQQENQGNPTFNLGNIGLGITPEMLIALLIAYLLIYEPRAVAQLATGGIVGVAKMLGGIAS